jgi:hypothetical protein
LKNSTPDATAFAAVARNESVLKWYAIVDAAQHRDLPGAILENTRQVRCLFDVPQSSPVASKAPHLVELNSPLHNNNSWKWILRHARSVPCVSIISSSVDFDVLFNHLVKFTQVKLPDGDVMFFAFWDPAILGSLIGQADDVTLYIRGPILSPEQNNALLSAIRKWWYWDRDGALHVIDGKCFGSLHTVIPLELSQSQVDDLVEANVPDQILYYVLLNQPMLLSDIEKSRHYKIVRSALLRARDIGLSLMGDLVNFVCLELIYGNRMHQDEYIVSLLHDVKNGKSTLLEIAGKMP